jgi:hypothetical protein
LRPKVVRDFEEHEVAGGGDAASEGGEVAVGVDRVGDSVAAVAVGGREGVGDGGEDVVTGVDGGEGESAVVADLHMEIGVVGQIGDVGLPVLVC